MSASNWDTTCCDPEVKPAVYTFLTIWKSTTSSNMCHLPQGQEPPAQDSNLTKNLQVSQDAFVHETLCLDNPKMNSDKDSVEVSASTSGNAYWNEYAMVHQALACIQTVWSSINHVNMPGSIELHGHSAHTATGTTASVMHHALHLQNLPSLLRSVEHDRCCHCQLEFAHRSCCCACVVLPSYLPVSLGVTGLLAARHHFHNKSWNTAYHQPRPFRTGLTYDSVSHVLRLSRVPWHTNDVQAYIKPSIYTSAAYIQPVVVICSCKYARVSTQADCVQGQLNRAKQLLDTCCAPGDHAAVKFGDIAEFVRPGEWIEQLGTDVCGARVQLALAEKAWEDAETTATEMINHIEGMMETALRSNFCSSPPWHQLR